MIKGFIRAAGAMVVAAIALAGCASAPRDITNYSLKPVQVGMLVNEDITIIAADGSFTIKGGSQFTPPFQANVWNPLVGALADQTIVEGFPQGRAAGGRNVMVHVAGHDKPLYGVLVLSQIYQAVTGPASRSYQIVIPKDKIDAAYAGRTSVVYENGAYVRAYNNGYRQNLHWRTWVLWLSATPL